jgi:hypothetical protein
MLIEQKNLKHWIDNFYGYGSWQAKTWFIGYEESSGELPEEVAHRINYFQEVHPNNNNQGTLCDIRELYKKVRYEDSGTRSYENLYEYRFGANAIQNNIWKNLVAFEHGFKNQTVPDLLEYQKQIFTCASVLNESWILLFPLPSPHNHAWYYSWLEIPELILLRNRITYQQHLYQQRITTILSNIRTYQPEVVLMYSMNNLQALKKSVAEFFPSSKFKSIKSIKQHIPQYHLAQLDGTMLLITTQLPTLKHNRIETGFDWEEMGKRVAQS